MSAIFVPFARSIKRGMRGPDIRALKRALRRAGYGKGIVISPVMGPIATRNLHRFQKAQGLTQGPYTLATHKRLARFYDSRGAWLVAQEVAALKRKTTGREKVRAAAFLGYHNRASIHYTQSSWRWQGMTYRLKPPKYPNYADCSSFATWCYYASDLPDPNVLHYSGGFTGTLCQHGKAVTRSNARPGDLVFYGSGPPWHHVAIYVGSGRVISHGSEAGPLFLGIDYRSDRGQIRSYLP